jgi:hypothetical protein
MSRMAPRRLRRRVGMRGRDAEARRLELLARSSRPIVAGPWTGPVGMELLYWIPFLNWLTTEGGVDPERIVAISRGGARPWYARISGSYVELLDHFSVARVAQWHRESLRRPGSELRTRRHQLDRSAFELALKAAAVNEAEWLHPMSMQRLFGPRWELGASSSVISSNTLQRPLPPVVGELPPLPTAYAALKAYFSPSLPDTPENRSILQRTVDRIAEETDVVLLGAPDGIGEHEPFVPDGDRIHHVALEPRTNLAVQTEIVRNAEALVSTYGGFSYLGPYVGTPTLALYSDAPPERAHLDAIDRVGLQLGEAGVRLFRARHVGTLHVETPEE